MNTPASPPLRIQERKERGLVCIELGGSADLSEVDRLSVEMNRISAERPKLVVIDLGGLTFIASLAIGQLVAMRRAVVLHGGQVVLCCGRGPVADVIEKARLHALFAVYEDQDAAFRAFGLAGVERR